MDQRLWSSFPDETILARILSSTRVSILLGIQSSQCLFLLFAIGFLLSILPTWERASNGSRSSFWRVCFVELEEQAEVEGKEGIDKERISRHVLSISGIGWTRRRRRSDQVHIPSDLIQQTLVFSPTSDYLVTYPVSTLLHVRRTRRINSQ